MSDSGHIVYWKNSINISKIYSISGYSRAKEATGFYCKELEMAFDAGLPTNDMPAYICLTHLHNDHVSSLNKMLIENKKQPTIFIPNNNKFEHLLVGMLKYIYLSSKFIHPESEKGKQPNSKYPYKIVKLNVGESYKFKETKNGEFYVEGLPSDHGVESISFGVYEMRNRCKTEYQNLDKSMYGKLRSDGIDFMEKYRHNILCYMSDTSMKAFSLPHSEKIFEYPVVMIECTFIENDDLSHAKKKNHMHWKQLEKIMENKPNQFILTHFSKKYTWGEVRGFFDEYFKKNSVPANMILWLHTGAIKYNTINTI